MSLIDPDRHTDHHIRTDPLPVIDPRIHVQLLRPRLDALQGLEIVTGRTKGYLVLRHIALRRAAHALLADVVNGHRPRRMTDGAAQLLTGRAAGDGHSIPASLR